MTDTDKKGAEWLRSPIALELLKPRFADIPEKIDGTLRSAMIKGAIRCQARFVSFETKDDTTIKRIWSIPKWVWALVPGTFSLLDDRYVVDLDVALDEHSSRGLKELVGVWGLDMQGLQFHEAEFRDFFTLPAASPSKDGMALKPDRGRPVDMDKWEDFALGLALTAHVAGPEAYKSRRALYIAVENVLRSLDKSAMDEKSVRKLLDRFLSTKDEEKIRI